jgi:hypothetical protein
MPGQAELRVTTDASFYEENADSVELWSPGGVAFPDAVKSADGAGAGLLRNLL